LGDWRHGRIDWPEYERRFLGLMERRGVARMFVPDDLDGACLLCAEPTAERCHRRLAAEHLARSWGGDVEIVHL
jgi:hypothetical protein